MISEAIWEFAVHNPQQGPLGKGAALQTADRRTRPSVTRLQFFKRPLMQKAAGREKKVCRGRG